MAAGQKMKTHKGLAKRVRVTRNGKVVRRRGGHSHLLSGKSSARRRKLRQAVTVPAHVAKMLKRQAAT